MSDAVIPALAQTRVVKFARIRRERISTQELGGIEALLAPGPTGCRRFGPGKGGDSAILVGPRLPAGHSQILAKAGRVTRLSATCSNREDSGTGHQYLTRRNSCLGHDAPLGFNKR